MRNSRIIILSILLFATALVAGGCRGYEDGPVVSFRSVQKRLINTWWYLDSISIDGVTSPNFGDSILIGRGEQFSRLLLSPDTFGDEKNTHIEAISGKKYPGYYELKNDHSDIALALGVRAVDYKILRLTDKEFQIISKNDTLPSIFISFQKP